MDVHETYYARAARRRLTRRRLLQGAATGAGLAAVAAMGCGGGEGADGTASPSPKAEAPRRGGVARVALMDESPTYDAHYLVPLPSITWLGVYDTLMWFDELKPMPNIITKWEYADPTTLLLHVRDGVKYHDRPSANGRLLTAEDVAYGLNRARTPSAQIPSSSRFMAIDAVDATDAQTVRVKLKAPSASILTFIGTDYVVNRESLEALGAWVKDPRQAISVGPFMCTEWQPGVGSKAVRNPNYWDTGKPFLDGLSCTVIVDRAAVIATYRTGDSDFGNFSFSILNATEKKQLEKSNPQVQFLKSIQTYGGLFLVNNDRPPFNDVRLRKAIDLVVDRQQLVDLAWGGAAAPTGVLWEGYMPGYGLPNKEILDRPGYRQPKDEDIAEAKKLLAAAGFPNGMDLPADGGEASPSLNLDPTTASVAQFAKAGIKLHVDRVYDGATYLETEQKGTNLFRARGIGGGAEPGDQLRTRLHSKAPRNYARYKNPDVDRMIDQQDTILDTRQRQDLCQKIQRQAMDDVAYVFTVWPWGYTVAQPWLRGVSVPVVGAAIRTAEWWRTT